MKHYNLKVKLLTLLGVITLSMSSCGDWLLIEPKTFVTEDNFWNEKSDVDQMVAGVYCMLQNSDIIQRCIVWGELRSDNIQDGKDVAKNDDLYRALRENLRANNEYTDWSQFYKTINACNIVIERAPSVAEKDPTYTPSQVLATQAEMKAIKALCMFYLVRAFKDCPYPNHAYQSELDLEPMPAADGDSIVRVLIGELEECVGYALKKYPEDEDKDHNSNVNRITQSGIYAILCDLCLWNNDYEKVITYAEKIIDQKWLDFDKDYSNNVNMESGGKPVNFRWDDDDYTHILSKHTGYPLYPCYSGNEYGSSYNAIFGDTQNSFESIFELAYTPSASGGNYLSNGAIKNFFGSRSEREQDEGPLYAHENVVTDAINKLYKVYDHQYDLRYYTNTSADEQWSKGYPAKYVCNEIEVTTQTSSQIPFVASYSGGSRSDRNWIFYRLTDVMLMEAEALVELAGKDYYTTDENGDKIVDEYLKRAFSIIWVINRRSLMTPHYINTTSVTSGLVLKLKAEYQTQDGMRELVQKERRRELMFEGKRWFDLLRRCHRDGQTTDYIKKNVPAKGNSTGVILFVNYESLFWPYNKTELKANTALTQKPFYGGTDDEDKYYESSQK